jgi:hypothetical protein
MAKAMEILAAYKQKSQRFHIERFSLKKLNEAEVKEKYLVEVSNRFAALKIWMLRCKSVVLGKR